MNKVFLMGRLTKDPNLNFIAGSGLATTRFSVATKRQFKKDEADFIGCVAFGKTAETIAEYLTKGKQIALEGHIKTGSYTNAEGVKIYTTDVIVDKFEFVGYGKELGTNKNDDMTEVDEKAPWDE